MAPDFSPDWDTPHRLELSFQYDTEATAETIERSLAREVGQIDDDRSATTLVRDGRELELRIVAGDHVALRAAMNTWCALADVAERTAAIDADG